MGIFHGQRPCVGFVKKNLRPQYQLKLAVVIVDSTQIAFINTKFYAVLRVNDPFSPLGVNVGWTFPSNSLNP